MDIVIKRREIGMIGRTWGLVYGRRKIGKTFMLRNFFRWDYYISVGREGSFWLDGGEIDRLSDIDSLVEFILKALNKGKTVVLDEFQRLSAEVIERLTIAHPRGILLLSGSSMAVIRSLTGTGSPFLGLVKEFKIGLIDPRDMIEHVNSEAFLDYMVYLRDPWLIPMMKGTSILRDLYDVVTHIPWTIPSLVGEVFIEEDRKLTAIYEGITRCIGAGRGRPSEIASILYARGVINKDSSSAIVPYIKNLLKMGILKEVKLHNRKGVVYRMLSPIFSVFYYIAEKYPLEYLPPTFKTAKKNIMRVHALCYEDFIVDLVAHILDGQVMYSTFPEIDGIIVDRKGRIIAAIEVKHGRISQKEKSDFLDKTENFRGKRIIVAKNAIDYEDVIGLTPANIIEAIRIWKIPKI